MADRKDLKEPKGLAEFWMRSFRIRLNLLSARLSASQSYTSDRLGKSVSLQKSEISDASVLRQKRASHGCQSLTSQMHICISGRI
jgi:hypothetical protein